MGRFVVVLMAVTAVGCLPTLSPSVRADSARDSIAAAIPAAPEPLDQPSGKVEPTAALTLPAAVALALVRNPDLAQYAWQIRADEARTLQAGLRLNPEASLLVEDVLGTGDFEGGQQAQTTLELAQTIELGGKRAARVAAASAAERLTAQDYEVKRVDVTAGVTRRFIRVLAAQEVVALADRNVRLAEETVRAVARRVDAGAESALASTKARVELARSRIAGEHAHHELAAAQRELSATWAADEPRFAHVEGALFRWATVPDHAALVARLDDAPDVARQRSERRLREAEARVAETKRIPDLTVAGGIRRLEGPGEESFLFGVSMPLPFSDRAQGTIAEAGALLAKSDATARATTIRLRTLLFTVHQELVHATLALDTLEREILPETKSALGLARRGFDEGRFSYLELVDAQRTLVAVERERIETAESYHQLVLELERLLGGPLHDHEARTAVQEPERRKP